MVGRNVILVVPVSLHASNTTVGKPSNNAYCDRGALTVVFSEAFSSQALRSSARQPLTGRKLKVATRQSRPWLTVDVHPKIGKPHTKMMLQRYWIGAPSFRNMLAKNCIALGPYRSVACVPYRGTPRYTNQSRLFQKHKPQLIDGVVLRILVVASHAFCLVPEWVIRCRQYARLSFRWDRFPDYVGRSDDGGVGG